MKKTLLTYFIFTLISKLFAQTNLVPNPSFESYTACPNGQGQINLANGWVNAGDSPDYFNSCANTTFSNFGVPYNWCGFQQPSSGNSYAALGTYVTNTVFLNGREFISNELINTLVVGVKYYVSIKANLGLSNSLQVNCATKNLGALFTKQQFNFTNPIQINYSPKVKSTNFITDTVNWTQIFGSFVADSAYNFITIGNFFKDAFTDTLIMNNWNTCSAYYFVDDICVSTDSIFTKNFSATSLSEQQKTNNSVRIFPNPTKDKIFLESESEIINFKLYTIQGQFLKEFEECNMIDLGVYANGVYIIEISDSNKQTFKHKLIKI